MASLRRLPPSTVPLSIAAGLLAAVASAVTLSWDGAFPLPDPPPPFNGALAEARGWSAVTLALALPALTFALVRRETTAGRLLLPGTLFYLVYTYLEMAVSPPFTTLYLVYVAAFACAIPALIGAAGSFDLQHLADDLGDRAPRRSAAAFALITGVGLALVWLKEIVARTIAGELGYPQGEAAIGHVVHALDLGLQTPLGIAAGVLLVRRAPASHVAAMACIVNGVLMGAALTAMVAVSSALAGGSPLQAAPFALLPASALALAVAYLRAL